MGFLRDGDFADLPDDDWEAFAKLERISRDRLEACERDESGGIVYDNGLSYMTEVAGLAAHYCIPDISYDQEFDNFSRQFALFTRAVDFRTVQIRARRAQRDRRNSVEISGSAREKIQHYLEKVKAEIEAANIPEKRKRSLMEKVADFERELAEKRFNLARAMALFALAAAASHDFVGTLLEAPKLIISISEIIGGEKVEDEEKTLMLPTPEPFRAIPDFRPKPIQVSAFDSDLDDEVPF